MTPVRGWRRARDFFSDPFVDPYLDPQWGILRNLMHARTQEELDVYESQAVFTAAIELEDNPVKGRFDLAHLQEIHRRLFGDIYDWAGQLRTIDMHKVGDPTGDFHPYNRLTTGAESVFERLAEDKHLRGLNREPFVDRLAEYLDDVNRLHPFREGNGRTQRAFFSQLADHAGYTIRWRDLDPNRNAEASRAAHHGDRTELRAMLGDIVLKAPPRAGQRGPGALPADVAVYRPAEGEAQAASSRAHRKRDDPDTRRAGEEARNAAERAKQRAPRQSG